MQKDKINFSLVAGQFAAEYRGHVILLDILKNEYLSLNEETGRYLVFILKNDFLMEKGSYFLCKKGKKILNSLENLDIYIHDFLKKNIIEFQFVGKGRTPIALAKNPIGLDNMSWIASQRAKYPTVSLLEIAEALLCIAKVQKLLKKGKLAQLFSLLDGYARKYKILSTPEQKEIDKMAYILDKACILYPAKILCLAWASTFVMLFLKRGWCCELVMGIQTSPFYAHAWVELNGKIINDDSQLQERLAPIFRLSFEEK